jgi:uncharacterized lipoprotein YmbA
MPLGTIVTVVALGVLTAGCAQESRPSNFYVLSYPSAQAGENATRSMREGIGLGIGPVALPQYLERPQIVIRSSRNSLALDEFERWGGRLQDNFTAVLTEVLSSELETDRVSTYPWARPEEVEYQVIVDVTAFETDADGQVVLDARWSIVDSRRQVVRAMARSNLREAVTDGTGETARQIDYDAVTAAMSRNIAALGRDIAAEIRALMAQ